MKEEQKGKKRLGSWRISLHLWLASDLDPQTLSLLMKWDNQCVLNLRYDWMSFNRKHSWCKWTYQAYEPGQPPGLREGSDLLYLEVKERIKEDSKQVAALGQVKKDCFFFLVFWMRLKWLVPDEKVDKRGEESRVQLPLSPWRWNEPLS